MIYKSYLAENDFNILKENFILFYGENLGLKNEFKDIIKKNKKDFELLRFNQEDLIKDQDLINREIDNLSLFSKKQILIIDQVSDKIYDLIEKIIIRSIDMKIYFFSDQLDKRSKLRSFFEKRTECGVIACYQDNEITLKKKLLQKLKGLSGLTPNTINLIIENCNLDRVKLNNEIEKIQTYFNKKKVTDEEIEKLLNLKTNEDINILKDEALNGNTNKTNDLLGSTTIQNDEIFYLINLINQRLLKIKNLQNEITNNDIDQAINSSKPPIFWKDKNIIKEQLKKWNTQKINHVLDEVFLLENNIKTNSMIDKSILIKKLVVDICNRANF